MSRSQDRGHGIGGEDLRIEAAKSSPIEPHPSTCSGVCGGIPHLRTILCFIGQTIDFTVPDGMKVQIIILYSLVLSRPAHPIRPI